MRQDLYCQVTKLGESAAAKKVSNAQLVNSLAKVVASPEQYSHKMHLSGESMQIIYLVRF